jgi:hypothetical protein
MKDILAPLRSRLADLMINLIVTGVILLILAVLIVWTDFVLEVVVGVSVIVVAYVMFYGAYKLWRIKNMLK